MPLLRKQVCFVLFVMVMRIVMKMVIIIGDGNHRNNCPCRQAVQLAQVVFVPYQVTRDVSRVTCDV